MRQVTRRGCSSETCAPSRVCRYRPSADALAKRTPCSPGILREGRLQRRASFRAMQCNYPNQAPPSPDDLPLLNRRGLWRWVNFAHDYGHWRSNSELHERGLQRALHVHSGSPRRKTLRWCDCGQVHHRRPNGRFCPPALYHAGRVFGLRARPLHDVAAAEVGWRD